jgi:hypothetical protein
VPDRESDRPEAATAAPAESAGGPTPSEPPPSFRSGIHRLAPKDDYAGLDRLDRAELDDDDANAA